MDDSNRQSEHALDLSRDEQWILHHVVLDRMELEAQAPADTDAPPVALYRVFEKLEAGTYRFSQREYDCLRDEVREYVECAETPERDRPVAERLLDELERSDPRLSTVESPP